jgi:hypothetical protein
MAGTECAEFGRNAVAWYFEGTKQCMDKLAAFETISRRLGPCYIRMTPENAPKANRVRPLPALPGKPGG